VPRRELQQPTADRADTAAVLHVSSSLNKIKVDVYHHPGSGHANQDRWTLQPFEEVLRVAVVDGVTPWSANYFTGDAAQWAAATCVKHLLLPGDLTERLTDANDEVHDPAITPSRRQAMAAVAAADLFVENGQLAGHCVVAADCEVWVIVDDMLLLGAGGDFLRPAVRGHIRQQRDRWQALSFDERLEEEAALLEDPATQVRHAVGRYPAPVFSVERLRATHIVLATDGARLAEAAAIGVTLDGLPEWLQGVAARADRDDMVCAVVTAC
jgi:hypothetical protein